MDRLLIVGDFACSTGFAQVTQNVAKHLRKNWEIDVLAINYAGDAHPLQKDFNLFPASLEGDVYGLNRIQRLIQVGQYNAILIVNDIWIIDMYLERISKIKDAPPVVFYTPVDAKHLKPTFLEPINKWATRAVFYTQFGYREALESGLRIPAHVIPHGVDQNVFGPMPTATAREQVGLDPSWYITLMVDRN